MRIPVQEPAEDLSDRPSAPTSLGVALGVLGSAAGAAAYVVAVGYLDTHAVAAAAGAVLDGGGSVVAIAPPAAPWWPAAGVAALTAAVFLAAWRSWATATSWRGRISLWTGTLTLIVLGVALMASTEFPFSTSMSMGLRDGTPPEPTLLAWARNGALSPATHAFAGVLLVLSFLGPRQRLSRGGSVATGPSAASSPRRPGR
jgi:hypothetical protein